MKNWRELRVGRIPIVPLSVERVVVTDLPADEVLTRLASVTQPKTWLGHIAGPHLGMRFYGNVQADTFNLSMFDPD